MSKKVFHGWCSKLAKANEFLAHQADLIDRPDFGWGFYLKKSECDFSHDHMPPKRITITVEVEDT